ncbi:MAG: HD domain-containing protein [Mariprofundales bacterium]
MKKLGNEEERCEIGIVSPELMKLPDFVIGICQAIVDAGGQSWLVGGCVRDALISKQTNLQIVDYDLEIYGLPLIQLQSVASQWGRVQQVGKAFSVIKLCCNGVEIDMALPRRERSCGVGHRDFSIISDPNMSPEQASIRRDFTMNAIMYNPLSKVLLDYHDGQKDLHAGVLRHVGPAFIEDPLRPLRAMQFCARFGLTLTDETAAMCRKMVAMSPSLPKERIWQEWRKWALADRLGKGLRALADSGWISCYPPLARLVDTPQEPRWHPEGDVWQHTIQVCIEAAKVSARERLPERQRLVLIFAALCHDLGKPATTKVDDTGSLRSRGHTQQGVKPTLIFLTAIGAPRWLSAAVIPLVREHLVHLHGKPTARAVRRLANRLQPSNIVIWEQLIEADTSGRRPHPAGRPAMAWLQLAQVLQVIAHPPAPVVTGKWLLAKGVAPGPAVGKLLEHAWQAQLDGEIKSLDDAERWWNHLQSDSPPDTPHQ